MFKKLTGPGLLIVLLSFSILTGCEGQRGNDDSPQPAHEYYRWNDIAQYLAGMDLDPATTNKDILALSELKGYEIHKNYFKDSWEELKKDYLSPMMKWRNNNLKHIATEEHVVLYPFSGPDFLNIFSLFPGSAEYILFGLEPPGSPPDVTAFTPKEQPVILAQVRKSLYSILNFSFFRTLAMKKDLNKELAEGTGPILLLFMARTGNTIKDVYNVRLVSDGHVYREKPESASNPSAKDLATRPDPKSKLWKSAIPGLRIVFRSPGSNRDSMLTYYSVNVANYGMDEKPWFPEYIKSKKPTVTFMKAASYLLHNDYFSTIRDAILDTSEYILQDDSGMPVRFLAKEDQWDLKLFGQYSGTINLFKHRVQKDLKEMYRDENREIKPLGFGIGYIFRNNKSNLMLAEKVHK